MFVTSMNPPSYVEQFKQNWNLFLRSRSEELLTGGAMLLTLIGRYDTSQFITSAGIIRHVLIDMALEVNSIRFIDSVFLIYFLIKIFVLIFFLGKYIYIYIFKFSL